MERTTTKIWKAKDRISWGSVIAGIFTVMAISVLLSILSMSISLFMLDPTDVNPASGIGTNMGIWSAIALIVSFAVGGFIAGKLAGADGMIHGFLVWAATLIITVILMAWLAIGAVRTAGNILGSVTSAAGSIVSGVGSAVGGGVSGLSEQVGDVFGNIDFGSETDRKEVRRDVRQALRKSGVAELQPEYLDRQMNAVKTDLNRSVKRLATNPNNADKIINDFLTRLNNRADNAFKNVDRADITKAIANNSNMSQAEVEKAVDEYAELIGNAREQGREQIESLQQNIEQAKQDWEETKQNAREEANNAANAAARSALISFFSILIGAVISVFAGQFGAKKTEEGYEV